MHLNAVKHSCKRPFPDLPCRFHAPTNVKKGQVVCESPFPYHLAAGNTKTSHHKVAMPHHGRHRSAVGYDFNYFTSSSLLPSNWPLGISRFVSMQTPHYPLVILLHGYRFLELSPFVQYTSAAYHCTVVTDRNVLLFQSILRAFDTYFLQVGLLCCLIC